MNTLIIGGSSGLGLAIAHSMLERQMRVYITGRSAENIPEGCSFIDLDITSDTNRLRRDLDDIIAKIPPIDIVVYAAGFLEKGHVSELSDDHIIKMINVGLVAPALILQRILKKQGSLRGFIAITSTSQWIPREMEPVYTTTKAGLSMFAQSVSLDAVDKTLVVGPAGMNTSFWIGSERDPSNLLSPHWVAEQILQLWDDEYVYRLARILRDPTPISERVQILETRFE